MVVPTGWSKSNIVGDKTYVRLFEPNTRSPISEDLYFYIPWYFLGLIWCMQELRLIFKTLHICIIMIIFCDIRNFSTLY